MFSRKGVFRMDGVLMLMKEGEYVGKNEWIKIYPRKCLCLISMNKIHIPFLLFIVKYYIEGRRSEIGMFGIKKFVLERVNFRNKVCLCV